jgi:hypothetical protein
MNRFASLAIMGLVVTLTGCVERRSDLVVTYSKPTRVTVGHSDDSAFDFLLNRLPADSEAGSERMLVVQGVFLMPPRGSTVSRDVRYRVTNLSEELRVRARKDGWDSEDVMKLRAAIAEYLPEYRSAISPSFGMASGTKGVLQVSIPSEGGADAIAWAVQTAVDGSERCSMSMAMVCSVDDVAAGGIVEDQVEGLVIGEPAVRFYEDAGDGGMIVGFVVREIE